MVASQTIARIQILVETLQASLNFDKQESNMPKVWHRDEHGIPKGAI